MATQLWGKVFFKDQFAGYIREEPGDCITFTYDSDYISAGNPAIAHSLPVRETPYHSYHGLHPFFDNLVSEGWLEQAQSRCIGDRNTSRFKLLLAFGVDCAGAVSVIDPEPVTRVTTIDPSDTKEHAVLISRASLSGVQPKLAIIKEAGQYRPTGRDELSTHIAKFPSATHPTILETEYLTTTAFNTLIPDDTVVSMHIDRIKGIENTDALLIERFDRQVIQLKRDSKAPCNVPIKSSKTTIHRIHFEEFNQLLKRRSKEKYNGAYNDMATFISEEKPCLPVQNYRLYKRILAGLLLGNTDMHLKNFALFHTETGLRLTPSYDQVAASIHGYKTVALSLSNNVALRIGNLKPTTMIGLGRDFGLSDNAIKMARDELAKQLTAAKDALADAKCGSANLKDTLIDQLEKRWNGTVALIGKKLSKKP